MTDEELREALVWLYADDCGLVCSASHDAVLRRQARQAVWDRLMAGEAELRVWMSRLVREVFLSDQALAHGHGIDEACEFWSWFDQAMWSCARSEPRPTAVATGPAGDYQAR